jgi:prepilin peptidase CpaA
MAGAVSVSELFTPPVVVVMIASIVAALTDIMKFKIYNILTLPLLVAGLLYHAAVGGMPGLLGSVLGLALGGGILLLFYLLGGMGAGDVKFLAAVGAWLGVLLTFYVFLASAIAAGIYALVLILVYGSPRQTYVNIQIMCHRMTMLWRHLSSEERIEAEVQRIDRHRRIIPFAAMMAVGMLCVLVYFWLQGN